MKWCRFKIGALKLANATSNEIFTRLIAEPLRQLRTANARISHDRLPVIIIDALDEYGGWTVQVRMHVSKFSCPSQMGLDWLQG